MNVRIPVHFGSSLGSFGRMAECQLDEILDQTVLGKASAEELMVFFHKEYALAE